MISFALLLCLSSVIPGPGWSTPVAVTEEPVHYSGLNRLVRDESGRFHLVYSGYGNYVNESRIGYTDEDPQMLSAVDGVVDEVGNLYIVYKAGYLEPVYGYFPTFGWFDYSSLGLEGQVEPVPPASSLSVSMNPVRGGVQFFLEGAEATTLQVYDLAGREVARVFLTEGTGFWDGTGFSGVRLPFGVYTVVGEQGISKRLTLLQE